MLKKRTIPANEIRLFEGKNQVLRVECPQSLLVRLLHFLSTKGFDCGIARISSQNSAQRTQSIVSFEIDGGAHEEVKYAVRVFLSAAKVKFTENSGSLETVFSLVTKGARS